MTNRRYFAIVIFFAILGLAYALKTVFLAPPSSPLVESTYPVAKSPFASSISAEGVIEASSEDILIGTPLVRIVDSVEVSVGMEVKKGDILLHLDNAIFQSEKNVKEFAYKKKLVELAKLKSFPRPEDLVPYETEVDQASANLELAKYQYEMAKNLKDSRSLSQEEFNRRRFNVQEMEAKLAHAKAERDKLKAGSWKYDIEQAEIEASEALANLQLAEARMAETVIRSPIDGVVLQINVHKGELTPTDSFKNPLMVLGNIESLHCKVEIDQFDIPYFHPQAHAVAFLQGNANIEVDLQFVRINPLLVSKQTLSDDITKKVDAKVLPVIYSFKKGDLPIYVGQHMDVFIQTEKSP